MAKCKLPPTSANQEQVKKPKLAGKVLKQKTNLKLIEGRKFTLLKKGQELATLCNAQVAVLIYGSNGSVQTWPNNSNTVRDILFKYKQAGGKKICDRSVKSIEHIVADTTGEGLDQNPCSEGLDQNPCSEGLDDHIGLEVQEELEMLPQESLMGLTGFLESKEQNLDETIYLIEDPSQPIEGSNCFGHPDNNSHCNPPTELAENIWDNLMSEDFDNGQTLSKDSIWPWQASDYTGIGISTSNSLAYQNSHYPDSPNCIGTGAINSDSGFEQLGFLHASGDFENCSYNIGTGIGARSCSSNSLDDQNNYYPDIPTSSSNLYELGHDSHDQWGMLQANED